MKKRIFKRVLHLGTLFLGAFYSDFARPFNIIRNRAVESIPPSRIGLRPADAFAHLGAVVTSSNHLLFPRERPFLDARRSGDPFWHREIAFSTPSAPVSSISISVNFLLSGLHQFPFVMPDVILSFSLSFPDFLPFFKNVIFAISISAFLHFLSRFYLLFYKVCIMVEKCSMMTIISSQFAHNTFAIRFIRLLNFRSQFSSVKTCTYILQFFCLITD